MPSPRYLENVDLVMKDLDAASICYNIEDKDAIWHILFHQNTDVMPTVESRRTFRVIIEGSEQNQEKVLEKVENAIY